MVKEVGAEAELVGGDTYRLGVSRHQDPLLDREGVELRRFPPEPLLCGCAAADGDDTAERERGLIGHSMLLKTGEKQGVHQ